MLPDKRTTMEAALDQPAERAGTVLVLLWIGHPDVQLPDVMRDLSKDDTLTLTLRYSWRYRPPLALSDRGIRATLERQGTGYETFVPWDAVATILEEWSGTHVSWPIFQVESPERADAPTNPANRAHLRLLVPEDE